MPFDEDPSENRCELDLCVDEIHRLRAGLTTKESQTKQLEEIIDRLTAENSKLKEKEAHGKGLNKVLVNNAQKTLNALQAKDNLLRELLTYAQEGLMIDEILATHIEKVLKGE